MNGTINPQKLTYLLCLLSPREKECLDCLLKGMQLEEIAMELTLSPQSVQFYLENSRKMLNHSRFVTCSRTAESLDQLVSALHLT